MKRMAGMSLAAYDSRWIIDAPLTPCLPVLATALTPAKTDRPDSALEVSSENDSVWMRRCVSNCQTLIDVIQCVLRPEEMTIMSMKTVRLDDETEKALEQIMQATGFFHIRCLKTWPLDATRRD